MARRRKSSDGRRAPGPGELPPAALDGNGRACFLIVCLGGISRVVNALPVLHALRSTYPDWEIGWAVDGSLAKLLVGHPELGRLHEVPVSEWSELSWWRRRRAMAEFGRELAGCGYTAAVDVQSEKTSARLAHASGARFRLGYAPPEGARLRRGYYGCRIIPSPGLRHVAERNLSLLVPLCVRRAEPKYVFPDLSDARKRLARTLGRKRRKYAVIHPGSGRPSARWPLESYTELARCILSELSLDVLVTGSGDVERSRAEGVARAAGEGPSGEKAALTPPLELDELAALIGRAALFVGGDSGPMQIASGLGVPTVAIFGPTLAERRGPRGKRSRTIDAGLGCSGCGREVCPDGTDACMRNVAPEAVLDLAREVVR